jgi:hypothetical protein
VQQVGQDLEAFLADFFTTIQTYEMEFDVHSVCSLTIHLLFIHLFSGTSLLARCLLFIVLLCLL